MDGDNAWPAQGIRLWGLRHKLQRVVTTSRNEYESQERTMIFLGESTSTTQVQATPPVFRRRRPARSRARLGATVGVAVAVAAAAGAMALSMVSAGAASASTNAA